MTTSTLSDAAALAALKSTFGYSSFRLLQREIVSSILSGRDVFVLMPTGGGKSLCYQLPALLRDGVTVVVSPLISLMKDQVDALRALAVQATYINSSLDTSEIGRRQGALLRGEVKLLYIAPERLMTPAFLNLLSTMPPSFFAIDEAHCISEWGHDFRPEYRELRKLRELFPKSSVGAFTATATQRVQADIKKQLGLQRADCYRGSFNRPNLYYEVRPKDDAFEQMAGYLRRRGRASGIIYCASRAGTERLAEQLRLRGFVAAAYHAGLEANERRRRQDAFSKDDTPIIVATIAFGMGIDKPDVRFVIHYDLPRSLEGYYQESGRAGRDGEPSDCILFFSYGDVAKQRHFINQKAQDERHVAEHQLRQMIDWATAASCRRRTLLSYFDEVLEGEVEPCCDVCRLPRIEVDATIPAQMFLSCVKRTGERFGTAHLIEVLRGSQNARVLSRGHDKLTTYGVGKDRSNDEWETIARELLTHGYMRQSDGRFAGLQVTPLGHQVLLKNEPVILSLPVKEEVDRAQPEVGREDLFEQLRGLRKRLADERGLPPYVIFHDSSLRIMARDLPTTRVRLLRVHGVGQRKVDDYGDTFLRCIRTYIETGTRATELNTSSSPPIGDSARTTMDLFSSGMNTTEVAEARNLAVTTIEGHIAEAIECGVSVDASRLIAADRRRSIESVMDELGLGPLAPIKERLGEDFTYSELRYVRALMRQTQAQGGSA